MGLERGMYLNMRQKLTGDINYQKTRQKQKKIMLIFAHPEFN